MHILIRHFTGADMGADMDTHTMKYHVFMYLHMATDIISVVFNVVQVPCRAAEPFLALFCNEECNKDVVRDFNQFARIH